MDKNVINKKLNLEEYQQKKLFLESNPSFAWFALTGRCNLFCEHCPVTRQAEENRDISEEVYERFCNEVLPTLEEVIVGANNYGEQMLSEKIEDFLDRAFQEGVKVKIWTNGTLLKGKILNKILETNTDVTISIEGVGENYAKIRHVKYDTIEKNIRNFVAEKHKRGKSLSLGLAFTAFKSNLNDVFQLLELSVDSISINYVQPKNAEWEKLAFSVEETKEIETDFIPRLLEKARSKNVKIKYKKLQKGDQVNRSALSCECPWLRINIRETGDVLPCCIAGDSLILGNIKRKSFRTIWNGRKYRALRKSFVNGKLKSTCRICKGLCDYRGFSNIDIIQKAIKSLLLKLKLYGVLKFLMVLRRKIRSI